MEDDYPVASTIEDTSADERHTMTTKRGRPPTARGAYNPHPGRKFGRVSDEDWQRLQAAAKASGKSFTQWALEILLRRAKRDGQ